MTQKAQGHGVVIASTSSTGNAIRRNAIFKNEGRGIDLADTASSWIRSSSMTPL